MKQVRDDANTLAARQQGLNWLPGPLLALSLVALPVTWHLPLLHTELLIFLENDVTMLGAVRSLAEADPLLCAVVVLFGMAIPFFKLVALLYAWFALPEPRAHAWIALISKLSKFSMLDVMLIAFVIVGLKGIGMGKVSVAYGLWAYAAVVISVLVLSSWMQFAASPQHRSRPVPDLRKPRAADGDC